MSASYADPLRVAIVHEWLQSRSGSEKTFEQLAATFPEAALYALTINHDVEFGLDRPVTGTFLQRSRFLTTHRNLALPLMPLAHRMMRTRDIDVVISSSHAFSRFFAAPDALHLSYVYTPLRYAWLPEIDGRGSGRSAAPIREVLKRADSFSTRRVDSFAAISTAIRERIQDFYDRDAEVIFPPVDVNYFRAAAPAEREEFVLGFSRWIPYKRLDLVIKTAQELGVRAVIAGAGPAENELRALAAEATVPVDFVVSPTDDEIRTLYSKAMAVVFPANEDFGIVPVEAQATGTPVVACDVGGSKDTVLHGVTGALVTEPSGRALAAGVREVQDLLVDSSSAHVEQFSQESFRRNVKRWFDGAVSMTGRITEPSVAGADAAQGPEVVTR